MIYTERFYRDFSNSPRWKSYRVKVETTDLFIRTREDLSELAKKLVEDLRNEIKKHIQKQSCFLASFKPVKEFKHVHPLIKKMYRASFMADVGPMAAVAGAVAETVGEELLDKSEEVIIENGGDIYLNVIEPVSISIFAGKSPFSGKICLKIDPQKTPSGICTSSGSVGHSLSFGAADAATIISNDTSVADATATGTANIVKTTEDFDAAILYAMNIKDVSGVIIVYRDKIAAKGDIEFCAP